MFDPDAYEAALDVELRLLRGVVLHHYPDGWTRETERRAMRRVLDVDLCPQQGTAEPSHPALQSLGMVVLGGLVAERLRIQAVLRGRREDG